MGESTTPRATLRFDRRIRLEFRGATITSEAGLLACRELDDVLGLTETASECLQESRGGRNVQHRLVGLLRQSVYSRLAGYEDTNDAERLADDPTMRVVVGRRGGPERPAASTNTMSRFETEVLTQDGNVEGLGRVNAKWVDGAMSRTPHRRVILDMDSSESPVHGGQEGASYNGHFGSTCYHPLFVFNQFGDCEGAMLRAGNVHSAHRWRDVLDPILSRYGATGVRRYFRADAATCGDCPIPHFPYQPCQPAGHLWVPGGAASLQFGRNTAAEQQSPAMGDRSLADTTCGEAAEASSDPERYGAMTPHRRVLGHGSESPVQEGASYNGHFGSTCYHPLFVFNQFGDCEGTMLRAGNVHSAHRWRDVLDPILSRYGVTGVRRYFRADAAFATGSTSRSGTAISGGCKEAGDDFWYGKVEWHRGELFPRVGFIVTNMTAGAEGVVRFYNGRGTAEQWIKEGKYALNWTRLSCHRFVANRVRLSLFVLAYNLGNFLRRLCLPKAVKHWSLRSVQVKLIDGRPSGAALPVVDLSVVRGVGDGCSRECWIARPVIAGATEGGYNHDLAKRGRALGVGLSSVRLRPIGRCPKTTKADKNHGTARIASLIG